ncbi:hypothetical protein TRFO_37846 [Tritrichomonas foetus]|uniref:Myb-like DNA-binding domain containing protein n=1 Tax=Tritrichomonas foetus TaxID=1144522 RepID=A0A1J4JCJ8_9EUKA|nr:hypothetical protein TRFO_37846 [Tritrichomonas foetus]|eukprot:OHS95983.1 hypothetical protein TRFO_37846 [Tritrichomonas foetus]
MSDTSTHLHSGSSQAPIIQIPHTDSDQSDSSHKDKKLQRKLFSIEEDAKLRFLVQQYGSKDFKKIASFMPGRTPRQVRERYKNYLSPEINNGPWSRDEDALLRQKYAELGPKWSKIADFFPSRSDINVKNRWTSIGGRSTSSPVQPTISNQSNQNPLAAVEQQSSNHSMQMNLPSMMQPVVNNSSFSHDQFPNFYQMQAMAFQNTPQIQNMQNMYHHHQMKLQNTNLHALPQLQLFNKQATFQYGNFANQMSFTSPMNNVATGHSKNGHDQEKMDPLKNEKNAPKKEMEEDRKDQARKADDMLFCDTEEFEREESFFDVAVTSEQNTFLFDTGYNDYWSQW